MKKLISLFLAVCMAAAMFPGCSSAGDSPQPSGNGGDLPTLRVAVMPLVTSLPVKYAMDN